MKLKRKKTNRNKRVIYRKPLAKCHKISMPGQSGQKNDILGHSRGKSRHANRKIVSTSRKGETKGKKKIKKGEDKGGIKVYVKAKPREKQSVSRNERMKKRREKRREKRRGKRTGVPKEVRDGEEGDRERWEQNGKGGSASVPSHPGAR